MRLSETLRTKKAEETFSAALIIVLLIILPVWGGVAMLVGSAIGLVAYLIFFRERLRSRGLFKTMVLLVMGAAVLGGIIAFALTRGHWP